MTRAIAFVRTAPIDIAAHLRTLIVTACGLALVLAGQSLPF